MVKAAGRWVPAFALILMLLTPGLALQGASDGLILWSQVVLPTLLPFMLCSQIIVAAGGVRILTAPFAPFAGRLLHLSEAGCFVLVTGLLCGYPMGAKTAGDFVREGRIPLWEGHYLMALANHPSPMFLLGYVAPMLKLRRTALLLASLYAPLLLLAPLALWAYRPKGRGARISGGAQAPLPEPDSPVPFEDRFLSCLETMVKIGGYIMLFSMASTYLLRIRFLPIPFKAWALGVTEITTGTRAVSQALPPVPALLCTAMACAFGGWSGIYQTRSVIKNTGLSIRHYILWKVLHSLTSVALLALLLAALPLRP